MRKTFQYLPILMALPFIFVGTAQGSGIDFVIDTGENGYAVETMYGGNHVSLPGSQLTAYTVVRDSGFVNGPFTDLNGNGNEYTVVLKDMVSLGTISLPAGPGMFIHTTSYAGGSFSVYGDAGTPHDFANTATFVDGVEILSGPLSNVNTQINDLFPCPPGASGTLFADYMFTGGSLIGRVDQCTGDIDFTWTDDPCIHSIPAGFQYHTNGHFGMDDCGSTGAESASWSGVKSLFR